MRLYFNDAVSRVNYILYCTVQKVWIVAAGLIVCLIPQITCSFDPNQLWQLLQGIFNWMIIVLNSCFNGACTSAIISALRTWTLGRSLQPQAFGSLPNEWSLLVWSPPFTCNRNIQWGRSNMQIHFCRDIYINNNLHRQFVHKCLAVTLAWQQHHWTDSQHRRPFHVSSFLQV